MTGIIQYFQWLQRGTSKKKEKKQWFWFGPSRLICTFQFQLKGKEQGLGAGVSIRAIVQRKGEGKKWLILKEQCALFTQLQPPPSITSPLLSYFLSLVPLHPPSTPTLPCSLAPAERLTRAHEKGSSVKGQCWAATPRMPPPVQSNKAGCPLLTGCLGERNWIILACLLISLWLLLCYFLKIGWSRRWEKGKAPQGTRSVSEFKNIYSEGRKKFQWFRSPSFVRVITKMTLVWLAMWLWRWVRLTIDVSGWDCSLHVGFKCFLKFVMCDLLRWHLWLNHCIRKITSCNNRRNEQWLLTSICLLVSSYSGTAFRNCYQVTRCISHILT